MERTVIWEGEYLRVERTAGFASYHRGPGYTPARISAEWTHRPDGDGSRPELPASLRGRQTKAAVAAFVDAVRAVDAAEGERRKLAHEAAEAKRRAAAAHLAAVVASHGVALDPAAHGPGHTGTLPNGVRIRLFVSDAGLGHVQLISDGISGDKLLSMLATMPRGE